MGVLTPHVRMDKGSSDLGDVTVVSSIFFIVVFRNMMGMSECSQEVSMWHDRTKIRDTEDSLVAIILILKYEYT